MAKEIFISYSRKDFDKVKAIKDEIDRELGLDCWMDLDGIESGDLFKKVIIKAINEHDTFLFMLSANSMASPYALKELSFAASKHKRVILVFIEPCQMIDDFLFDYQDYDNIDWNNPLQHNKLMRNLGKWYPSRLRTDSLAPVFSLPENGKNQIHVFIIYKNTPSCSKITQQACEQMLKNIHVMHSEVDIMINVLAYHQSAQWQYSEPLKLEDYKWCPQETSIGTHLGAALQRLEERLKILEQNRKDARIFRKSLILLISNGLSDDNCQEKLSQLFNNEVFCRANRYAINLDSESDLEVLARFTGKKKKVFDLAYKEKQYLAPLLQRLVHMGLYAGSSAELDDDTWGDLNDI